jgi:hypothetical protein
MGIFTPSHLGRWERLYKELVEGERHSLTPQGTWMLAEKPGLVAVFDGDEVVYITGARSIAKTVQGLLKGGAVNELRTLVAVIDLNISPRTADIRAKNGPAGQRIDKVISKLSYTVAPAQPNLLEPLSQAFIAVADPRYNGPTALANLAIDALPK